MQQALRLLVLLVVVAAGCGTPAHTPVVGGADLRIAISSGRMSLSAPDVGLVQIKQNQSVESLVNFGDDGRPRPAVVQGWTVSEDRLRVSVHLRDRVQYQDGTLLRASDIVQILQRALPRTMGPAFEDVAALSAPTDKEVEIRFRRPSGFALEILEAAVMKPGSTSVGTGPYEPVAGKPNELHANERYYLGKPLISRITIESYPTFRAAWADMLRDKNDMLYDVGVDALDSLQNATNIAHVFTFLKRYQYMIVLNPGRPQLRASGIRQALNLAIDRQALINDAMSGHGAPSGGPVPPRHWAAAGIPMFTYDAPKAAAALAGSHSPIKFSCLVMSDHERLALVVKRQLEAVGVDMAVEEVTSDELLERVKKRDFDAFLMDVVSGPTLYRLYRFWHSGVGFTPSDLGNARLDEALDLVRHAASDEQYRQGVAAVQQAGIDDPPAIFLAWSEGARAVSRRFEVVTEPAQRDILSTLRLWKPTNAEAMASRN